MMAWETQDDTEFVVLAMSQIAEELIEKITDGPTAKKLCGDSSSLKFSDFTGVMYDESTSAQSAILQRAATLKEYRKEFGYVRMA
jgi:hypothetical protein